MISIPEAHIATTRPAASTPPRILAQGRSGGREGDAGEIQSWQGPAREARPWLATGKADIYSDADGSSLLFSHGDTDTIFSQR